MDKREEMRKELEKFLPKKMLKVMDLVIEENSIAAKYLEKVKPYSNTAKGKLYTVADMLTMFRFGLHHNDSVKPEDLDWDRKPLLFSGMSLKEKSNPEHIIQIKGYTGDHYKVKEQGKSGHIYYSMDYIEDNFELL